MRYAGSARPVPVRYSPRVTLDRYTDFVEIGRGGAGVVYKARGPEGSVAVKLLHRSSGPALARFERERRLHETLGVKEGFVPFIEAGDSPRGPYLVMPLVEGGTLRARLEDGSLPVADTVALARALAKALARAHRVQIVHRDLKPENILFTGAGREPLIADLGLAKHFAPPPDPAHKTVAITLENEFKGTAGYMPREQMRSAKDVTAQADVFALGAILYECLAGRPAFPGETAIECMSRVEAGSFEPLAALRPETPDWLVRVVERCLAPDAAQRFEDARGVVAAIDEGEGRAEQRRAFLVVLGVAAVALALAIALFAVMRRSARVDLEPPASAPTLAALEATPPGPPRRPATADEPPPEPTPEPAEEMPETLAKPLVVPPAAPAVPAAPAAEPPPDVAAATSELAPDAAPPVALREAWVAGTGWFRHRGNVLRVGFSPDGTKLLSAGVDGVRVSDAETGRELLWHGCGAECAAFSSDGTKAYVASLSIVAVDLAASGAARELRSERGPFQGLAVSSDGKRLVAIHGPDLELFDLDQLQPVHTSHGSASVSAVAFAGTDDRVLALVAGAPAFVNLTELRFSTFKRSNGKTLALAVSTDGATRVFGESDGRVIRSASSSSRLVAGLAAVTSHVAPGPVPCVALAPDGRVALGCSDRSLRVLDANNALVFSDTGLDTIPSAIAFSPDDGRRLAVGFEPNGAVRCFDAASGKEIMGHAVGPVTALAISEDGTRALVAGSEAGATLDARTGSVRATRRVRGKALALAVSPDGKEHLIVTDEAMVHVDATKKLAHSLLAKSLTGGPAAAFPAPHRPLAARLEDGTLRVLDVARNSVILKIGPGPRDPGARVALSKDGELVAMADPNGTLAVFEVAGRRLRATGGGAPPGAVRSLAFTADGRALLIGSDRALVLYDLVAKRVAWSAPDPGPLAAPIPGVAAAVSVGSDDRVRLHALADGHEIAALPLVGGDHGVSVAAAPDGTFVLVGTTGGRVLRFDLVK